MRNFSKGIIYKFNYFHFICCLLCILTCQCQRNIRGTHFGYPCSYNETELDCSILSYLDCIEDTCRCSKYTYQTFTIDAKITCSPISFKNSSSNDHPLYCYSDENCPTDQYCNGDNVCRCKNSKILIKNFCWHHEYLNPLDDRSCEVKEIARICNPDKLSYCRMSKCICFPSHYYNFTTKSCVAFLNSPIYSKHGYKAIPGEYCTETDHCVEGLKCLSNFTCACPSGCNFLKNETSCDCGNVKFESPKDVFWVGFFLSLFSIIFWGCMAKKTYRKMKNRTQIRGSQTIPIDPLQLTTVNRTPSTNFQNVHEQDLPPPYSSVVKEQTDYGPSLDKKYAFPKNSDPPSIGFTVTPNPLSDNLPYSLQPPTAPTLPQ